MRLVSRHRCNSSVVELEEASACSLRGNVTQYISEEFVGNVKLALLGRSSRSWVGKMNMSRSVVTVDMSAAGLAG